MGVPVCQLQRARRGRVLSGRWSDGAPSGPFGKGHSFTVGANVPGVLTATGTVSRRGHRHTHNQVPGLTQPAFDKQASERAPAGQMLSSVLRQVKQNKGERVGGRAGRRERPLWGSDARRDQDDVWSEGTQWTRRGEPRGLREQSAEARMSGLFAGQG